MQENFLPWFALHGHHVLAVSFRGHGSSSDFAGGEDKYHQSVEDLAHVISSLPQAPVLVAHSMGGFFAQRSVCLLFSSAPQTRLLTACKYQVARLSCVMSPSTWAPAVCKNKYDSN